MAWLGLLAQLTIQKCGDPCAPARGHRVTPPGKQTATVLGGHYAHLMEQDRSRLGTGGPPCQDHVHYPTSRRAGPENGPGQDPLMTTTSPFMPPMADRATGDRQATVTGHPAV